MTGSHHQALAASWPNNARVALAVIVNLEHWDWELPGNEPAAPAGPFRPDLVAYSQHEYGNRVGVFRIFKIFDKYGVKPTVAMDTSVAENYPFLVKEVQRRKLEVIAHGTSARRPINYKMSVDTERAYIRNPSGRDKGHRKAASRVAGPGFQESINTPNLLCGEGIRYVCDWANDEQPYRMKVQARRVIFPGRKSGPGRRISSPDRATGLIGEYADGIKDTFDMLYSEGTKSGRMMVINIHPWIMGWPWRSKHLDQALAYINKSGSGVWKASGHEILDWYRAHENAKS